MLDTIVALKEIEYPESDGTPMAETGEHRIQMTEALIWPLQTFFRERQDVYISGNLFLYYEEGNPRKVVAPDVFVVLGVPNKLRRVYKLWEEGKAPDVVFELTSPSTRDEDVSHKRFLYEALGVEEYFLFDPLRDYLQPPLQGFRLEGETYYTPLRPERLPTGEWQLSSNVLGLILQTEGRGLRLFDPARQRFLLKPQEVEEARQAAEAEVERLKALLAQRNGG